MIETHSHKTSLLNLETTNASYETQNTKAKILKNYQNQNNSRLYNALNLNPGQKTAVSLTKTRT